MRFQALALLQTLKLFKRSPPQSPNLLVDRDWTVKVRFEPTAAPAPPVLCCALKQLALQEAALSQNAPADAC